MEPCHLLCRSSSTAIPASTMLLRWPTCAAKMTSTSSASPHPGAMSYLTGRREHPRMAVAGRPQRYPRPLRPQSSLSTAGPADGRGRRTGIRRPHARRDRARLCALAGSERTGQLGVGRASLGRCRARASRTAPRRRHRSSHESRPGPRHRPGTAQSVQTSLHHGWGLQLPGQHPSDDGMERHLRPGIHLQGSYLPSETPIRAVTSDTFRSSHRSKLPKQWR